MLDLLLFLALSTPEVADTPQSPGIDAESKEQIQDMADELAGCAGVWDFVATFEEVNQRPASAKQARDTASGAILAAAYIASTIYHSERPESPKTYGEFLPAFEGRRESSYTHMLAMVEREDVKGIELRMNYCGDLLEAQEKLLTDLRRDALSPK